MTAFNKQVMLHLEKAMQHAYLEKHMKKPYVDTKKISMLRYIFEDYPFEEQKKLDLMIAVLLVQIALDTHELVPVKSQAANVKSRELTVLAGDFYSGLYYKLLAQNGEIAFIQTLATAIKQINEAKMTLYHENISTWQQLMEVLQRIETTLFTSVADALHVPLEKSAFVRDYLFAFRLMDEIANIQNKAFSYIDYYVQSNLVDCEKNAVIVKLEQEIDRLRLQMENYPLQLPYYLLEIIDFIYGKNTLSAVEEG